MMDNGKRDCATWRMPMPRFHPYEMVLRRSATCRVSSWLISTYATTISQPPELELNHGYCDFFLLPDHTHYDSQHSYILELKVLSKKEFDEEAKFDKETKDAKTSDVKPRLNANGKPLTMADVQWEDAVEQIKRYAEAPRVEALRQGYNPSQDYHPIQWLGIGKNRGSEIAIYFYKKTRMLQNDEK